jgi:hypothetical protein
MVTPAKRTELAVHSPLVELVLRRGRLRTETREAGRTLRWDRLSLSQVGLAAAFRVPWNETNQPQNVKIEIQTDDGESVGKVGAQFEVGRPSGMKAGQDQRLQLAANLPLTLRGPGGYVIVARAEGQEAGRVPFSVMAGPALEARRQPG